MTRCTHPARVVSVLPSGLVLVSCADCGQTLDGSGEYPRRELCPGCTARRDDLGRLPVGFCGSACLMATVREQRLAGRSGAV